jgi:hypothetical protein
MDADIAQKFKHIARLHEIEEDALSIKRRCDLKDHRAIRSFWPHIAVMSGEVFQLVGISNVKTVSVSNAVTEVANEF